jgi:hypothetical protein
LTRADWPGGSKIVEPSHAGRPETIRALERAAFGRNRHREERSDAAIQRRPTETAISGLLRFARRWFDPNAICSTVKLNRGLAPVAARRRRDGRPQCANSCHSPTPCRKASKRACVDGPPLAKVLKCLGNAAWCGHVRGLGGQSKSGVSGWLQPPPPSSSLLLDALDPDDAEAGVFIADVRL